MLKVTTRQRQRFLFLTTVLGMSVGVAITIVCESFSVYSALSAPGAQFTPVIAMAIDRVIFHVLLCALAGAALGAFAGRMWWHFGTPLRFQASSTPFWKRRASVDARRRRGSPGGTADNSPGLQSWEEDVHHSMSPGGTTVGRRRNSVVPPGLEASSHIRPGVNSWAILGRPGGTSKNLVHNLNPFAKVPAMQGKDFVGITRLLGSATGLGMAIARTSVWLSRFQNIGIPVQGLAFEQVMFFWPLFAAVGAAFGALLGWLCLRCGFRDTISKMKWLVGMTVLGFTVHGLIWLTECVLRIILFHRLWLSDYEILAMGVYSILSLGIGLAFGLYYLPLGKRSEQGWLISG
jgi:hypothetical protein